jgi:hypothetical protein
MSVRRLTAAALGAAVLLAGCGGGEDEGPAATLPPVTADPTPSATAAGEVPPAAQEATPEGAAEFGRYFYETIDRAFKTLDTTELEAISAPECEVCQRYVTSIRGIAAEGQRVEGYDITVTEALAPGETGEAQTAQATVIYDSTLGRIVAASGEVVLEEPARTQVVSSLQLMRGEAGWTVLSVTT